MTPDLKKVISRAVAMALVYFYIDVGVMTDYWFVNECAELELDANKVQILEMRHDLVEVGVLGRKGSALNGHSLYGLTKASETPTGTKAN